MLRGIPGFLSLVFCLAAFWPGQVVAQAPQYVVTDLGTLGGDTSSAYGINNLEQVSGIADTTNDSARHAFLSTSGAMTDLGTLGDDPSYGYAVSNTGHVTGFSWNQAGGYHAYLYSNGVMHDIPGMSGTNSEGHNINSSDQIAGLFFLSDGFSMHAFLYSNGMLQDIGTLGGSDSAADGVNNSGQATGSSNVLGDGAVHAFLYTGNMMSDLGTLGGNHAEGYSINNAGQVAGFSSTTDGSQDHAFLYSGGLMNDLGTLGGTLGYGESINNSGQVTGHSNVTGDSVSHAFLYSGGTMSDLNSLVPASFAAYNIDEADLGNHMNDRGEVAAEGTVPATGNLHALLLTPRAMGTQFSGGLGELFGNIYNSSANSVANGGSVVVGAAEGGSHAAYWTLSRELTDLHLDSMSINAAATGVSADGRYVVGIGGNGSSISAFRYDLSLGQNSFLAAKSGDASSAASGTSADGSVTVGWSGTGGTSEKAVSWNGTNSPTLLGVLSGGTRSLAQSVSGDGSIITGYSQSSRTGANFEAFRWDSTNGMVGLGDLTGGNSNLNSQAFGISQDGTTIVGQANSNAGEQAFIWTQGTGMSGLGFISGTSTSAALGVSSDGSVVVGNSGTQAFVWDANHGIRNLQSILASEYGIVFAGWNLTTANGIAPDATEVVGQGTDSLGNAQAFAAQINSRTYRYMSGDSYVPFHTSHLGGHGTAVDILDGTAGGTANTFRTVTVATSKAANSTFVSDVANISGTGTDTYVVQLSYDLAAANSAFGSDQSLVLGWFNGSTWVNALDGNSAGTPTFVGGAYNHVPTLGNCSLDRVNHVVWACVNHGGQFAVINHVPPVANFSTWQAAYFTAQQLSDPTVSGASADPNHNGVPNLLEYAFNTNPLTGGALTNLPTAFHDPADSSYFAIVYTKFLGAADLTYTVQQSTDLSSWGTATTTNQILSDNGILQTIKAKVALTPGQKQLFLRLQVTH